MIRRALLPLAAIIALLAACGGDDGEGLFAGVGDSEDTDVEAPDDTGETVPDDTGAPVTDDTGEEPPDHTSAEPVTDDTADPFGDGGTPFTFPTLPDSGDPSGDPSGGGDMAGMEGEIVDAFAEEFASDPMFDEEQGRCIGQILYDELGIDGLTDIGQAPSPDQWPPGAIDTLMDAMWDCVDFRSLMVDEMTSQGATDEQAQCVWDTFSDDEWKEIFLEMAMDPGSSTTFEQELDARASDCR